MYIKETLIDQTTRETKKTKNKGKQKNKKKISMTTNYKYLHPDYRTVDGSSSAFEIVR